MTYPSKEEIEKDKPRNFFLTWSFVIALLGSILVFAIVNEVIIWLGSVIK